MKLLLTLATFLLICIPVTGQQTNLHLAATVSGTGHLGFNNPTIGGVVGGDLRYDKLVLSLDASLEWIGKRQGGAGYQASARETLRFYVKPKFFVQGGAVEQYYSVTKFSKSSWQSLIGVGTEQGNKIWGGNYRHDFTSENRQRIVELYGQAFFKNHVFVRGYVFGSSLRPCLNCNRVTGGGVRGELGLWF